MATVTTASDIETLIGRSLTAEETTEVEMYIEFAIGEIEAWLGRPVTVQTFTGEKYIADHNGRCFFLNTPVVSITSLTVNGESISSPEDYITVMPYGFDGLWEQDIEWPGVNDGEIDRPGYYGSEVTVTYTAGLDFPQAIKSLVTRAVWRKFNQAVAERAKLSEGHHGISKIEVEDYTLEYDHQAASSRSSGSSSINMFESDTDFKSIKRYRRRTII